MSRTGRYFYRPGHPKASESGMVHADDLGADTAPTVDARMPVFTDRYMEGVRAPDGTDIGSRSKRRAFMQANSLADADDFKGTWAQAAKRREAFYAGRTDTQARRQAIAEAVRERKHRR